MQSVFEIIIKLSPLIIALIQALQTALPGKGLGEKKEQELTKIVEGALTADPTVSNADIPAVMAEVEKNTRSLVATFNETGTFAK